MMGTLNKTEHHEINNLLLHCLQEVSKPYEMCTFGYIPIAILQ